MCGRGRSSAAPERLVQRTGVQADQWRNRDRYWPSYNIGPGGWLPVLRRDSVAQTILHTMKWGLVPSFTKKGAKLNHYRMFNARSERLRESPVFRRLLSGKRCVVVMNGFYEWRKEGRTKQPYYIHRGEDNFVYLAALYDRWQPEAPKEGNIEEEDVLYTVSIITTDSGERLQSLHDRMPVILPDEAALKLWLSGAEAEWPSLDALLRSYNGGDLVYHPVTAQMGNIKLQGKICCLDRRQKGIKAIWEAMKKEKKPRKRESSTQAEGKSLKKKLKRETDESTQGKEISMEVQPASPVRNVGGSVGAKREREKPLEAEPASPLRRSVRLRAKLQKKE